VHKVIFDNSGSMSELGKSQLLINTLRFSRQYIELNDISKEVSYYLCSGNIDEVKLESNKDIIIPSPNGSSCGAVISGWFLSNHNSQLLWFTDGYTTFTEEQIFSLKNNTNLIIVALGCDADLGQLKRFSCPVFSISNINAALMSFFEPTHNHNILPTTVEDSEPLDSFGIDDGDDDEW